MPPDTPSRPSGAEGEEKGFRPWASIEAGDLKDEYDRAINALAAYRLRATMLAIRLSAAEEVCEAADVYMGNALNPEVRLKLGASLSEWRKLTRNP